MLNKGKALKNQDFVFEQPTQVSMKEPVRSRNMITSIDFSNKTFSLDRQLLGTKLLLDQLYESKGERPQTSKNKKSVTNIYTNKTSSVFSDIES